MDIIALGYIGIQSSKLSDWTEYACNLLGMQQVDRASNLRAFRMDDRKQRLVITDSDSESVGFLGFETFDAAAMHRVAARLEAAGTRVSYGSRALADERFVKELIVFSDPAGHRIEVFHGAHVASDPFRPGRAISGFVTGALGMGHAVFQVENMEAILPFYRDTLGFGVSDYGLAPIKLYFFHLNPRHHSFAMAETGQRGFHHFMVELFNLDDVGQGYELAQLDPDNLAYTLGRHTNDFMTSFYTRTPSGFFVEYGWGGRQIDPKTWQPHETTDGPSLWGHDRLLQPHLRKPMQEMRLDIARRGIHQPVQVMEGNYQLNPGTCPWLDSMLVRKEE